MSETAERVAHEHVYKVELPGMSRWAYDYAGAYEYATGYNLGEWDGDEPHPDEERITIMHKRGRDCVLDLSDHPKVVENQECCMNRRYDCGHVSYGPMKRLPEECPECVGVLE